MLSPGEWYNKLPRDPVENVRLRWALLSRARSDVALQRDLLKVCKQDCLFFINLFVWQFNPNTIGMGSPETGPFITWEFQDEAVRDILDAIEHRRDIVIEKSREMGASWLCLMVLLWLFLFHDWKKFLVISRSEEAVDKPGDPDSLFWKIDFMLRYLPDWMAACVKRKKHVFVCTRTHSTITGQASTGKAGVGGRATAMFIDEFSQIAEDSEVLHRTSDTTSCRIFNGTHRGLDTAFYELCDTESVAGSFIRKLQMHWTKHPDKAKGLYYFEENKVHVLDTKYSFPADYPFVRDGTPVGGPFPGLRSPWYDDQCRRKGNARAVAMDLDINPSGSVSQFFDAILIKHLVGAYCREPLWEGELDFDKDLGRPHALEAKPNGKIKLWLRLDHNGRPPLGKYGIGIDTAQGSGATPSCLSVVNMETGEKVLEYADAHIEPGMMGSFAVAMAWLFKSEDQMGALICWEVPGPGQDMGRRITKDLGYRNVYMRKGHTMKEKVSDMPGWANGRDSKLMLLNGYHRALRERRFLNHSKAALEECLKFKYNTSGIPEHANESGKGDPSGGKINHGDRVMADAMACMICGATWLGERRELQRPIGMLSLEWRRELHRQKEREAEQWG